MSDLGINHHEVYARNLLSDKGFPPWLPRPVDIAEVGYVDRGRWMRLFNASKKPGDESNNLGVPNGYRPLDVGELDTAMITGGSPITNERGRSIEFGIKGSSAAIPSVMSAEGQYTFTSSKQEGAILVPGKIIDTADAVQRSRYIRYIRENSASWLEFANGERHGRGIRLIDLVLVSGWHKTASWGCAAFSQCSREITLTFNVGVGTTQGGVWGKWLDTVSPGVERHSGPVRVASVEDGQPSSSQNDKSPMNVDNLVSTFYWLLEYGYKTLFNAPARSEQMEGAADVQGADSTNIRDQGIFIRGYKICDRRTGICRIIHRHGKDGFNLIHPRDCDEVIGGCNNNDNHNRGDEDTDRDGGPSSSHRDSPSGGPGNSSSSPLSSSSRSQGGAMSRSSGGNSGSSGSSHKNHLAYNFELDDDLALYLQLNGDKEPTAVEIILEYILENSGAEFSLAHDDDVRELLQGGFSPENFAIEIRKSLPQIFVVDKVGMLYQTYMALLVEQPSKGHEVPNLLRLSQNRGDRLPLDHDLLSILSERRKAIHVSPQEFLAPCGSYSLSKFTKQHDDEFLDRHNGELDVLSILACLFSTVNLTYILYMESSLILSPNNAMNSLSKILVNMFGNNMFPPQEAAFPTWNDPNSTSILVRIFAYTSLSTSLLVALGAGLGKQWLGSFRTIGFGQGTKGCQQRQQKLDGLVAWHFTIIFMLSTLLQLSILCFGIALAGNIWIQQHDAAGVILGFVLGLAILYIDSIGH